MQIKDQAQDLQDGRRSSSGVKAHWPSARIRWDTLQPTYRCYHCILLDHESTNGPGTTHR